MIVAPGMGKTARAAGFLDVRELAPWQTTRVGELEITAAPGAHGVTEVTYVLREAGNAVYFGGDTRLIPELSQIAARFPSIQVALLSVNGLRAMGRQEVMNAEQAAQLVATLHAAVAVPIHYRFHGGWFTDTFVLSYDGTPERFVRATAKTSPATVVRVLDPGQRLVIETGAAGDLGDRTPRNDLCSARPQS
jgi:L-ascorbate metabolism protein UlaG (beta-lactamase superfamily)